MNTIIGSECTPEAMFKTMDGWTSKFEINGNTVGGGIPLGKDIRLAWHIEMAGGLHGKRILELGPLEGAHIKMMLAKGACEIIAIEGLSDCFLRCLVMKEAFQLIRARFLFGDFCRYVEEYKGQKFDIVSASGVLYHQKNPAELIFNLAKVTDTVFVWSQVANNNHPDGDEGFVEAQSGTWRYWGKWNDYGGTRLTSESYCGGLHDKAFWMYPDDMRKCFRDAGFGSITEKIQSANSNGDCVLFVARK